VIFVVRKNVNELLIHYLRAMSLQLFTEQCKGGI